MGIVASSRGGQDTAAVLVFGLFSTYELADAGEVAIEAVPNPRMSQGGVARVQAA